MTEPGNVPQIRRRRSRRHSRNRVVRRGLTAVAFIFFVAAVSAATLWYFRPGWFHVRQSTPPTFQQTELSRERLLSLNQLLSQPGPNAERPVYPYSVIPGGVEDAKELKWIAEHDPIVAAHYAGFDYDHARIVRLTLAQTVFMSYRIGNRIYWTRHRLKLHPGEKVMTDGKISLRARCGNRVEQVPQQAASPNEPPEVKFDQPVGTGTGTALQVPPVPYQSALLQRPAVGSGLTGPLSLYDPLGGGNWVPLSPPPLPSQLCGPGKKKGEGGTGGTESGGKKKGSPCGSPGVVPEPGTWILFGSGLILIYWQARRKFAHVPTPHTSEIL